MQIETYRWISGKLKYQGKRASQCQGCADVEPKLARKKQNPSSRVLFTLFFTWDGEEAISMPARRYDTYSLCVHVAAL